MPRRLSRRRRLFCPSHSMRYGYTRVSNSDTMAQQLFNVGRTGGAVALPPFQAAVKMLSRDRFYIELKPDETTVVSWKKLVKDSQKTSLSSVCEAPAGAHPALEARIAPEVGTVALQEDPLPPPPNRFNSVIEKIERLYKGGHSSDEDENLSDAPEDDKYDTSDSFIDDEELDEYFSVDKAKVKHTGFFINRGKLERLIEPAISPVSGAKKRKRRDIKKLKSETVPEDIPKNILKSGVRMKAAARKVSLSTGATSGLLDSTMTGLASLGNRPTQRESISAKESKSQTPGSEYGKIRDGSTCESKGKPGGTMGSYMGMFQNGKDAHQDASESRQIAKCLVVRDILPTASALELSLGERIDPNGLVKRESALQSESQIRDISKDIVALGVNKVTSIHKGVREDDMREAMGNGGKLIPGTVKLSSPNAKEVSPGRPKGTILERAIHDLERGVAELCPPSLDLREPEQASQSGAKNKRLPQDVKQKLAKVARLAQAKQGKIPDDLFERLMGILGHVMRVKTLKRNLKEMIEMGLSARQEKEGRLQDIKWEVTEMVKSRVSSLQAQVVGQREGSSDDFQAMSGLGERGSMSSRYKWDYATEDRICDLYEQYIEGMDEHKGPQIRKLYAELAELWPDGWMDNNGIKLAVQRAKERKKKQNKLGSCREESRRKQKPSGKLKVEGMCAEAALPFVLCHSSNGLKVFDQTISHNHPTERSKHDVYSGLADNGERKKYSKSPSKDLSKNNGERKKYSKSPGKDLSNVEKKRKTVEGSPILRRKFRMKLERSIIDSATTLTKSCLANTAQMSNVGSFQSPLCSKVIRHAEILPIMQPTQLGH